MRKNANEIIFDEIIVLGTPALFTDWRVDRASVPTDMKMYEVRHAMDLHCSRDAVQICRIVCHSLKEPLRQIVCVGSLLLGDWMLRKLINCAVHGILPPSRCICCETQRW